jgi:hypothetical protein
MADYYTQWSEEITDLTEEERLWWKEKLGNTEVLKRGSEEVSLVNPDDSPDYGSVEFVSTRNNSVFEDAVWFYSEEGRGSLSVIGEAIQEFLSKFRPSDVVAIHYAHTCSKMRRNSFNGGAMFVTADEVDFHDSQDWVNMKYIEHDDKLRKLRLKQDPGCKQ